MPALTLKPGAISLAELRRIVRGINITAEDPVKRTHRMMTLEGMTKRFMEIGAIKP